MVDPHQPAGVQLLHGPGDHLQVLAVFGVAAVQGEGDHLSAAFVALEGVVDVAGESEATEVGQGADEIVGFFDPNQPRILQNTDLITLAVALRVIGFHFVGHSLLQLNGTARVLPGL